MLEFILGRPQSGKTTKVIEKIKQCVKENKKTYLIVPEQQVHVTETMFAQIMPEAWKCFEVTTFSGICEMAFVKYGGLTNKSVDDNVKHLLIWYSAKSMSSVLKKFKKSKIDVAFSDMLLSAINELSALGISPEDLDSIIEESDDETFKEKFRDISTVYSTFKYNIKSKLNGKVKLKEDIYRSALEKIISNNFFEGSYVFIDSFSDFTSIENKILEQIIKTAENTVITVNLPNDKYNYPHVKNIRGSLNKLKSYTDSSNITTTVADGSTTAINPHLAKLERFLWDFSYQIPKGEANPDDNDIDPALGTVKMTKCRNPYEEAENVAIRILDEYSSGKKFSEMAVIMRDAESYKSIINSVFDKYHIPYFYSEKTDISTTSAARFILASIRAIMSDFRLEDILTITKTGLCDITDAECDMFEDYCVMWNIHGSKFYNNEPFNMNGNGYTVVRNDYGDAIQAAANRVKDKIIPPLNKLKNRLLASKNVEESITALYEYLELSGLSAAIIKLCENDLSGDDPSPDKLRTCAETLKVYDYIIDALSIIADVFKNEKFNRADLLNAIEIMFANTNIASVPPVDEYVTVGSASTLRTENIKIAFVMGLVEGEFPKNSGGRSIINNDDRCAMEAIDSTRFSSLAEKSASDELYFAYRALTTPTEKLYLSYPSFSVSGQVKSPSVVWNRTTYILGFKKEDIEEFHYSKIKNYTRDGIEADKTGEATEITGEYCSDYIGPEDARRTIGNELHLSKTLIETFMNCPYKYWCEAVLELRESKTNGLKPADIGTLVHYVLEQYIEKFKKYDKDLGRETVEFDPNITNDEILKISTDIVEDYVKEIGFIPSSSEVYKISRYRNLAYKMLISLDREFKETRFKILATEENLKDSGRLKPFRMEIDIDENFSSNTVFAGTVDRIDAFVKDNDPNVYVRIVDYKTNDSKFNVDDITSGKDTQLPAYLFAVTGDDNQESELFEILQPNDNKKGEVIPVSALYFSINEEAGHVEPFRSGFILNDPAIISAANSSNDKKLIVGTAKNAHVDQSTMDRIKNDLNYTIENVTRQIYSGKAPKKPSKDACSFCRVKDSCPVAYKDNFSKKGE